MHMKTTCLYLPLATCTVYGSFITIPGNGVWPGHLTIAFSLLVKLLQGLSLA
jgi:hypothetical protein